MSIRWLCCELSLCALAVVSSSCRETPRAAQAASPTVGPGEVRIDTASGKLAYIKVATPTIRSERVIAALPAQVAMNEDRTVRVLTPVAGRVASLDASMGDAVAAGTPLAHIVSGDLAQAASDFTKAQAAAAQSSAALARAEDLYQHHVAPLRDAEQARNDNQQTKAELARARSRLAALGADGAAKDGGVSSEYVLHAPIGGVIVDRTANPGAEVRPDVPTPLFTITSLDVVWLTANVYQRDLAAIHRGVKLRFTTDAAPGREFAAKVTYVSGTLDPQTRTAVVRAEMPNAEHLLRPLETGTARVLAPEATPVLVVPTKALVTHGSDTVVYLEIAPGRYVRRVVTVGDDDGASAVILSGIKPGDRVVVDGSLFLEGESERA
ncbi:MAG TPA: efflux RND transporter periplasmic adaptor subunit [Gemmatimonadaceae bacterium]|nr:efflux RND transporter periplasmic adaptor subunit [Gemmatimonadaceae bacterium]